MIIWINGAFGSGKTTTAYELHRRLPGSFVYDPENVGYFIRKNAPESFSEGDFQDIPLWREMNFKLLRMICNEHKGTVIVPMTIVNPQYFDELAGELRRSGIEVRHFILYASRETIRKRLRSRGLRRDSFALSSIERCVLAFDTVITDEKIDTENMNVDEVVAEIARRCGIALTAEKKTRLGRLLFRAGVQIRHIR